MQKILSLSSHGASAACLAIGFAAVGQWVALVAVALLFLAWLSTMKWRSSWLPQVFLVASIVLAAIGLFTGAMPLWMILSATFAISSWDLVLLDLTLKSSSSAETGTLLEKKHYQQLALALGLGLMVSITGRGLIRFQIPFAGMVFLAILALFSLEHVWHALNN